MALSDYSLAPADHAYYRELSRRFQRIAGAFSDRLEVLSIVGVCFDVVKHVE